MSDQEVMVPVELDQVASDLEEWDLVASAQVVWGQVVLDQEELDRVVMDLELGPVVLDLAALDLAELDQVQKPGSLGRLVDTEAVE